VTEISAAQVKELREATSAGIMDAKRALQETAGDFDEAVKLLRERGKASAQKRAGRETSEGKVVSRIDGNVGAIVAIGSETEPVSNNEEFLRFVGDMLDTVHTGGSPESLEEARIELSGKLGENIQVVGAKRIEAAEGESLSEYVHFTQKIGALVALKGGTAELGKRLGMQLTSTKPAYKRRDEVPAADVAAEREVLENSDEVQSKPENVREKIVEGMLNKNFFGQSVLLEQPSIIPDDAGKSIQKVLDEAGADLVDYAWYSVG
jgi:elongation factor Ts